MVFNVLSMMYDEPQNEAYNRMALDGTALSLSKLKSIKASMVEEEKFITYISILRYHSRWDELSGEDFKYMFKKDKITHNGYLMRVDVNPLQPYRGRKLPNYELSDICYDYLKKMTALCKKTILSWC